LGRVAAGCVNAEEGNAFRSEGAPKLPLRRRPRRRLDPLLAFVRVPIYEYKCPQGHVFETFQRISDPQPEVCEICGEGPLQRVLYPVAVHFKGSGFYSTDYGRSGRKKEPSVDGDKPAADKGEKKDKDKKKQAAES
jgi:putative FmdB family regulatory protein